MTSDDLSIMARTIWGEARGEPLTGKIAVAWVIKNRADHPGWWGKDIKGVCQAPYQFSAWLPDDPNRPKLLAVTVEDESFRECLYAVAAVLGGFSKDPTKGATHYHTAGISPKWAAGKTPNVKIGAHLFFTL